MNPRVLVAVAMSLGVIGTAAANAQTAPRAPAPSSTADEGVHIGVLLFGGIGPAKFNNVDKGLQALEARFTAAGFTSVSGSMTNHTVDGLGGGGVTFRFGQNPVGLSVTGRVGHGTGPAMSALGTRTNPSVASNVSSEYDPFIFFGVSIGVPINMGRAVLVEPMLDLTSWRTKNSTFENTNGANSTTVVARSGSDPGFGIRAAWFPTDVLGFGYELHLIKLNDTAPGLPSAPWQSFLEDSQSFISVYVRSKR